MRGGAGVLDNLVLVLLGVVWLVNLSACQIVFTTPPSNVTVALGSPARFDCAFTASNPVSIIWRRNGSVITPSSKFSYLSNNSLLISPTERRDTGTYTCVVTEQTTSAVIERSGTLTFALFENSFSTNPESQTVTEGDTLLLFCIHSGSVPPATITWTRNGNVVQTSSRVHIQSSVLSHTNPPQVTSTLAISPTATSDSGRYRCVATNTVLPGSNVLSQQANITVRGTPQPPTILQHPFDLIIASTGLTATFTCSASGEPPPTFIWTHNGTQLSPPQANITQGPEGFSTLVVTNIQRRDVGMYRCTASNSQGSATSNVALLELASIESSFLLQPVDTVAILGEDSQMDCLPPLSTPAATISWSKNFSLLTDPRFQVLQNGSLFISNVRLTDQGSYHCIATNLMLGVSRTSRGVTLTVLGLPTITPNITTVSRSQSASFVCQAQGNPPPAITWFKSTNQITADTPRVVLSPNRLTITNATLEDDGYYTCRAVFPRGTTEAQAYLDVMSPPILLNASISLTVVAGSPAIIPCSVRLPDPALSFQWSHNAQPLDTATTEGIHLLSNGSLTIASIRSSLGGTYTCVASNTLGTVQSTVVVNVEVPPTVTAARTVVNATRGNTVVLSCMATGVPAPTLTWFRNGTEVPSPGTPRYQLASNGSMLVIRGVDEGDKGVFQCTATNSAGTDQDIITLTVLVAPSVMAMPIMQQLLVGSTVTFSCSVSGDPTPLIRWLNAASIDVTSLGDPRIQVFPNGSLMIGGVVPEDQQQYICEASSPVGTAITVVSLTVLVAPNVSLPAATTAIQGQQLLLNCQPTGNPTPSITWSKDNVEIRSGGRVTIGNNATLVINNVFSSDEGNYSCQGTSNIGSDIASTMLTVLVSPVIQQTVFQVIANEGNTAIIDCLATGSPPPTVNWFHNSIPLPNPSVPRIQQAANNSLIVSVVRKTDEGVYICQATNVVGMESATTQLRVYVAPMVMALDTSIIAVQGNTITLSCTATGDPAPSLTWFRNGTEVPSPGTPRYQLASNGSMLVVRGVDEGDEGVFQCTATNSAGTDQDIITLTVLVPPTFTQAPTNSTATENTQHTLTCAATGDPTPLITWSRDGTTRSTQGTLAFPLISRSDTGQYTCTASNSAGRISVTIFLDVLHPPSVLQPPTNISVPLNRSAQFRCIPDGNPDPQISWQFQGVPIAGANGPIYSIAMVTGANGGQYTCVASNAVGRASATATLTVLFPPSAPTIGVVMATSSTSISVQWAASTNDGGSPITGYVVEYRNASDSASQFMIHSVGRDVLSTAVVGLTPFTTYDVRVRGENTVGRSDPSTTVQRRTDPDAPAAPGNFRILSSTSTTLTLTWVLPNPLNGILGAYQLQYGIEADFLNGIISTRLLFTTRYTVSGIQGNTVYRLRVRASTVSLNGDTLWGPYSTLRVRNGIELELPTEPPTLPPSPTLPSSPSQSPTRTTSRTETTQTSQLTQTLPTSSSQLQPQPITSQPMLPPVVKTSSSLTLVPTPTTTITITVPRSTPLPLPTSTQSQQTTTTTTTTTPPSPTSTPSPLTPPTVAPALVLTFVQSIGEILVYWREPTSGLDTFDSYRIFISPPPPPPLTSPIMVPKTPISGMYLLQGLANFTTYTVTVATSNQDGVGPLTVSRTATTPEAVPSAPQSHTVTRLSSQSILISWSPPDPPNGIIQDYEVRVVISLSGQLFTNRTIPVSRENQDAPQFVMIDGLDLGRVRYLVTISARTGAGRGPETEAVAIGTQAPVPTTATDVPQRTTALLPAITSTPPPLSTISPSPMPTSNLTPTSTPIPTPTSTLTPTPTTGEQDEVYLIIIIVPIVVVAVVLIVLLVVTVIFCAHLRKITQRKKRGMYQFSEFQNDGDIQLQHKQLDEEPVASDEIETSAYYVRDALDANFTFAPTPGMTESKMGGGEGSGSNSGDSEVDIGTALEQEGEGLIGSGAPIGRDALQEESPSHTSLHPPSSWEPQTPSDERSLDSEEGTMGLQPRQKLIFNPGDHSYAEMDAIRARKAQERARRFGVARGRAGERREEEEETAFAPEAGLSSGGLLETRIGAVGVARGSRSNLGGIAPEASAQMY